MWYWILILLCLHVFRDHAVHNGGIANAVEEKTFKGEDGYLVYNVVKRAADDGNSSGINTTDTVTNANPSTVLEYITLQGVGQNFSENVSVNQLNGTSNTDTNGTTDTQENSTAVTKTTDDLHDTVTESAISGISTTSTAATQTRTDVIVEEDASSTNSTKSNTTLTEHVTSPVTSVDNVTDTSHPTVTNKTLDSSVIPKEDNATDNILTGTFNSSISTANPLSSSIASVSSPVSTSPLSNVVEGDSYSNTTHSQITNTSLTGPNSVTESLDHLNNTQSFVTSNVMTTVPITTSVSNVPFSPVTSTSIKTVSHKEEVVTTDSLKDTTKTFTTEPLATTNSTSLDQPVNNSVISTTQQSIMNVTDTTTRRVTTSALDITEDSSHGEHYTVSGTPTTTSPSTTSEGEDSEIPLSEPEPSPAPVDTPGRDTNSSEYSNSTLAQPATLSVNITPEPTQSITETKVDVKSSTTQPKAFSTTVKYTNTTQMPQSQTTSYRGPVSNSSLVHPDLTSTSKPEEKTSVTTSKVEKTSTKPETYVNTPTKKTNTTTEAPPLSEEEGNDTPTFTPSSEPEAESSTHPPTPEPETGYPTAEPEGETDPVETEVGFNFDVFAEPGPDWPVAKLEWKQAWEFHIYFFGISFTFLGLYCLFCVIQLWKMDHLLSRHYFMTLQVLVMLICLFRASYLLIDAYNSLATFPIVLDYFLYSTVFPCLTAVFSILFYALLLAVRVRVLSEKVQKLWVLLLITGLHFALSFATDIIVGLFSTAAVMLLICQSFFIFWGLIIFIGYLVIFKKLYQSAINRQETLRRNSMHDRKNNITQGFQEKPPQQKYRLGLAVKVTLVSSFFGLACVCFELYGMFGVYGLMRADKPEPWPWWAYHSIVRCLEIAMCSSIAYVASQPLKYTYKKKYKDKVCLKALPCRYLCCADLNTHRDEASMSMDQYATSETDHLGWLKKLKLKKCSLPDTSAPYPPHTAEKYTDPDATLLVRKVSKPKPSMLVVEDGFVRIRREDEMVPGNQYDLDSNSMSSRSSDVNNVSASPYVSHINETKKNRVDIPHTSRGVSNAAFAQDDKRSSFHDNNFRVSFQGDNKISFQGDVEHFNDIADETDIDIAVTDCENSDGYETPPPASDENSGNSGDIFRPLSDIDLAASMESELERAFHPHHGADKDNQTKQKVPSKTLKTNKKPYTGSGNNGNSHTEDDWSDSSDGACRTPNSGLLKRPIRRCKSEESKEQLLSKMFDNNRYFSLSSLDSVCKHDVQSETFVQKL